MCLFKGNSIALDVKVLKLFLVLIDKRLEVLLLLLVSSDTTLVVLHDLDNLIAVGLRNLEIALQSTVLVSKVIHFAFLDI